MNEASLLVDQRTAARLLQVSERTIFNLRKAGILREVWLGTVLRFDRKDLISLIEAGGVKSPSLSE